MLDSGIAVGDEAGGKGEVEHCIRRPILRRPHEADLQRLSGRRRLVRLHLGHPCGSGSVDERTRCKRTAGKST